MSRRIVEAAEPEHAAPTRSAVRAIALAVIERAIADLVERPVGLKTDRARFRFLSERYGAARFLIGCPRREPRQSSYREWRAFWCRTADIDPHALEAEVARKHGALLRYILELGQPKRPRRAETKRRKRRAEAA